MLKLILKFSTLCLAGLGIAAMRPAKRDSFPGGKPLSIVPSSVGTPLPNVTPESERLVKRVADVLLTSTGFEHGELKPKLRPHCPTCTCKKKLTHAERQRAYRERKSA